MLTNIFPPEKESELSTCRAYISISLSNQTSASTSRLREIIEWTRDHVSAFDIVIGDYFHRHNLEDQQGMNESDALKHATIEGADHVNRIRSVLDSLGLFDVKIRPATTLYTHPSFHEHLEVLEKLWASSAAFQRMIEEGTDAFLERKSPTRLNIEIARRHSRLYQLEELAIFEMLSIEGYTTNVYPGAHLPVMKEIVLGGLQEGLPLLANMILVELRLGRGL
jgi:tRNA-dependent cyclodipeptide synthase